METKKLEDLTTLSLLNQETERQKNNEQTYQQRYIDYNNSMTKRVENLKKYMD